MQFKGLKSVAAASAVAIAASGAALASSHREAPAIANLPAVDGTDFYMFRSYESERADFVTLIANYLPLQSPYGGPNYFRMDPDALYEIHIDNNGDSMEDISFQFRFNNDLQGLTVPVDGVDVAVPLTNIGPFSAGNTGALNVPESYTVRMVTGDRRSGAVTAISNAATSAGTFAKPTDNIGNKSIADYPAYAAAHIYDINIPNCATDGRMFVGQRREGFVVNLGETFDLVNISAPAEELSEGARSAEFNTIDDVNVTSMALELPISCLTSGNETVIGAWTTSSLRQGRLLNPEPQNIAANSTVSDPTGAALQGGAWTQVSRLGAPLVNEVVIGLPDKDRFNASEPMDDAQFATYVTNPTLPELLEILFGAATNGAVSAPDNFPRTDLIAAFLTGVPGINQPANVVGSEMLRLNTATMPTPVESQNDLGVIGGDNAGFPNGRRPVDDVVDIELRVAMGVLCTLEGDPFGCADDAPNGGIRYTDGALPDPSAYKTVFPYLADPLPGSPSDAGEQ